MLNHNIMKIMMLWKFILVKSIFCFYVLCWNKLTEMIFVRACVCVCVCGGRHFLCRYPECRDASFVVFSTDVALQAHIANTHRKSNAIEVNFRFNDGPSSRRQHGNDASEAAAATNSHATNSSNSSSSSSTAARPSSLPPTRMYISSNIVTVHLCGCVL